MISRHLHYLRLSAMQDLTMSRFLYRENYQEIQFDLSEISKDFNDFEKIHNQ